MAKRLEREKSHTEISEGCNVQALENDLSQHNRKTLRLDKFSTYLQLRYITYLRLKYEFYGQKRYRQRKWNTFINTQRSESLMLNRFKEKIWSTRQGGDWYW